MILIAQMCEHSCTVGDGIVVFAFALGAIGLFWVFER